MDINGQKPQLPESKNEFQGKHPGAKRAAQVKIGMNNKAGDRVLIPLDTPYRTQFMAKAAHDGRKTQDTRVDEIFWNAWTGVFILKVSIVQPTDLNAMLIYHLTGLVFQKTT